MMPLFAHMPSSGVPLWGAIAAGAVFVLAAALFVLWVARAVEKGQR
jgi:hypothetical protein